MEKKEINIELSLFHAAPAENHVGKDVLDAFIELLIGIAAGVAFGFFLSYFPPREMKFKVWVEFNFDIYCYNHLFIIILRECFEGEMRTFNVSVNTCFEKRESNASALYLVNLEVDSGLLLY